MGAMPTARSYREDGLGYLLGDRGSGFNLGIRVLRDTLDKLRDNCPDSLCGCSNAFYPNPAPKTRFCNGCIAGSVLPVSRLSRRLIGELAEQGDPEARRHLSAMAHHLRHSVRQVRHKLYLPRDTPVYPLGGLWQLGAFFRVPNLPNRRSPPKQVTTRLSPGIASTFGDSPRHDAAYGAALLAMQEGSRE